MHFNLTALDWNVVKLTQKEKEETESTQPKRKLLIKKDEVCSDSDLYLFLLGLATMHSCKLCSEKKDKSPVLPLFCLMKVRLCQIQWLKHGSLVGKLSSHLP